MDGWMDGLLFYVFFNMPLVIQGHWEGKNERLCARESGFRLKTFPPPTAIKRRLRTASFAGQRLLNH